MNNIVDGAEKHDPRFLRVEKTTAEQGHTYAVKTIAATPIRCSYTSAVRRPLLHKIFYSGFAGSRQRAVPALWDLPFLSVRHQSLQTQQIWRIRQLGAASTLCWYDTLKPKEVDVTLTLRVTAHVQNPVC